MPGLDEGLAVRGDRTSRGHDLSNRFTVLEAAHMHPEEVIERGYVPDPTALRGPGEHGIRRVAKTRLPSLNSPLI